MLFAWLTVALVTVVTLFVALHVSSVMTVYLGSTTRRPRNVSDQKREPPPRVARAMGELAVLGFRRLGETELTVPDLGVLGPLLRRRRRHTAWIMADEPTTTTAVVIDMRPHVWLETWLADASVVHTTYGAGEEIDASMLRSTVVRGSIADAYRVQRVLVDERASYHGAPRGVHSMGDFLRNDAEYRQRFARRYLRRVLIVRQLAPAAVVLAVGLWMVY
ncbi:MAG TPA: hypothetical protein VMM78_06745, partial [Thermomicrobiales bacterium]|nr:hypothetical protein [Thermomicrobiales bacterium]